MKAKVQVQTSEKIEEMEIEVREVNKTAISKMVQNVVETMMDGKWSNLTWQCEHLDGWAINEHGQF